MGTFKEYLEEVQEDFINENDDGLALPKIVKNPLTTPEMMKKISNWLNLPEQIEAREKLIAETKVEGKKINTVAFKILKWIEKHPEGLTWGQIQDKLFDIKGQNRPKQKGFKSPETWNTNLGSALIPLYMKKVGMKYSIDPAKLKFHGLKSIDDLANQKIFKARYSYYGAPEDRQFFKAMERQGIKVK